MFKIIKFVFRLLVLVVIVYFAIFLYYNIFGQEDSYSSAQEEVRKEFGSPEQFMITYLPKGTEEDPELVREEVWFYPEAEKKIIFLGGEKVQEILFQPTKKAEATSLESKDFTYYSSLEDIEQVVGKVNLAEVNIPGFFYGEGEVETYASRQAVFIFEKGYLTYAQTIGLSQ